MVWYIHKKTKLVVNNSRSYYVPNNNLDVESNSNTSKLKCRQTDMTSSKLVQKLKNNNAEKISIPTSSIISKQNKFH